MRILVVEDDGDLRESLVEALVDDGFDASGAADGGEALRLLRQDAPDAVLLDLRLPVLSGLEVYAAMQADARLRDVPVIVTTSDPAPAPPGPLIMKKPVNLERLLAALRALDHHGAGA